MSRMQLRRASLPVVATAVSGTHRAAVRAARSLPALPLDVVAGAVAISERQMRQALRSTTPRGVCGAVAAKILTAGRVDDRVTAMSHRACPPSATRSVSAERSPLVRAAAGGVAGWATRFCEHPAAPRNVTITACADRFDAPLHISACPPAVLAKLAASRIPDERSATAANPGCMVSSLAHLANDNQSIVRVPVAGHRACPPWLLAMLADDEDWEVRKAAATNPALASTMMTQLAAVTGVEGVVAAQHYLGKKAGI